MSDMECPYCGAGQEVCHDDGAGYEECKRHEHTCSECGKTFVFRTSISFSYYASKANCLNGSDHDIMFRRSWPAKFSRMECRYCDYTRPATGAEIVEHAGEEKEQ